MRIIIEVDGQQTTVVEKAGTQETATLTMATNAGTPSDTLLQAVGTGPVEFMPKKAESRISSEAQEPLAEGVDAGCPPDWLVQALETSPSIGLEKNRYPS
jgi:hypothetical protein